MDTQKLRAYIIEQKRKGLNKTQIAMSLGMSVEEFNHCLEGEEVVTAAKDTFTPVPAPTPAANVQETATDIPEEADDYNTVKVMNTPPIPTAANEKKSKKQASAPKESVEETADA